MRRNYRPSRSVTRAMHSPDMRGAMPASMAGAVILEPFSGAWQQNREIRHEDMLAFHAVFACITLIASDISKLSLNEGRRDEAGVWVETPASIISQRLHAPNHYQTGSQFIEGWMISKLAKGNTYVYLEDAGRAAPKMHVLHPDRCRPLVSDSGEVFYELGENKLAGTEFAEGKNQVVPASVIIHDRFNCLYHPLVGISPLYAAALAVMQGRDIQNNSTEFFRNGSMPGGVLLAPGAISDATAKRLKDTWEQNHGGPKKGGLAVLGDGMKYEQLALTAEDSQLIEQLRWSAEVVASVFHVPPYKIGVGALPSYDNVQALNQEYYAQCLQRLITDVQRLLKQGLRSAAKRSIRFDLEALLMMDSQTQMQVLRDGVGSGIFEPDYARKKFNLPPTPGGATPYLQQQNYSLGALARRDTNQAAPDSNAPAPTPTEDDEDAEDNQAAAELRALAFSALLRKELAAHE